MIDPSKYNKLLRLFEKVWSVNTAYPGKSDYGDPTTPSFGQCVVTALVLQDLLGGTIVGDDRYHHYWNRLPDGNEVDLTRYQFNGAIRNFQSNCGDVSRAYLLESKSAVKNKTKERYEQLRKDFIDVLVDNLV